MPCRVCIKSHTCAFAASLVNGHVPVETKAAASEEEEEEEDPGVEDLFRRATFLFRAPVSNPRGCRHLMHAVPEFKKRNILKHVFLKISTLHAEGHGWPVRHVPFQKCSIFLQPDAGLSPAANMQTQPRPGTGKCILFFCAPIKRGESGGPCLL